MATPALQALIRRANRRLGWRTLVDALVCGLILAALAALILGGVRLTGPTLPPGPVWWLVLLPVPAALVQLRSRSGGLVTWLDGRLGAGELLVTAWELPGEAPAGSAAALIQSRARDRLAHWQGRLTGLLPLGPDPRTIGPALILALAALWLWSLPAPPPTGPVTAAASAPTAAPEQRLRSLLEMPADPPSPTTVEADPTVATLEDGPRSDQGESPAQASGDATRPSAGQAPDLAADGSRPGGEASGRGGRLAGEAPGRSDPATGQSLPRDSTGDVAVDYRPVNRRPRGTAGEAIPLDSTAPRAGDRDRPAVATDPLTDPRLPPALGGMVADYLRAIRHSQPKSP